MKTAVLGSAHELVRNPSNRWLFLKKSGVVGMAAALAAPVFTSAAEPHHQPNIVIILADDMGYADMGSFGSEIKTPNLDSLAMAGVRFTNFYTNPTCSPTRSVLLTGVDSHLNGLGNMDEWAAPNQWGEEGYEGYLNNRVVTLRNCSRMRAITPTWLGSGIWEKRRIRSQRHADSSATFRFLTGQAATGT